MTAVDQFLFRLDHPLKDLIYAVRASIREADGRLVEQIKWNAPSFALGELDLVTMKLFPPKNVQIIFHRGAKKTVPPASRLLNEDFGLLKWPANDRAVATFTSLEQFESQQADFRSIVAAWIAI